MVNEQGPQWRGHLLKSCGRGELPTANLRSSEGASKAECRQASTANGSAPVYVAVVNAAEQSGGLPSSHSGGLEKLRESCVQFSVLKI